MLESLSNEVAGLKACNFIQGELSRLRQFLTTESPLILISPQMSYEIVYRALFLCGHCFVQYGYTQFCIFHQFFWETSFLFFCAFLHCVEFDVTFENFCNICKINVYIVGGCQILCIFMEI